MNLSIFLFLILFSISPAIAQQSVNASGGEASGQNGTMSFSAGQVTYTIDSGTNGSVEKGVQQAFEISVISGNGALEASFSCSMFPNPATDFLTLKVISYGGNELIGQLFGMDGQLLKTNDICGDVTRISVSALPAGVYILKICDGQNLNTLKIYKIIKN